MALMGDANRIARPNGISVVSTGYPVGEPGLEHVTDMWQVRTQVPGARANDDDTR
jgi:hypothetical protein